MRLGVWIAAVGVLASCGGPEVGPCNDLCDALVIDCNYDAFPSYDSCLQGCLFDAEQGADVEGELVCVEGAACDTFAILECEHSHGQ